MTVDLAAATDFIACNARILDRRRFELLLGYGNPTAAVAAANAYRNPDGGYGIGLEPDLRSPESQPGAALHAFEVFEDIAPATAPEAVQLCDWLASVTRDDGALPFVLPITSPAGSAPWWVGADLNVSSLQITSIVTAVALRVARHDAAVAAHPWLERASNFCLTTIASLDRPLHALELAFAVRFLDAAADTHAQAADLLAKLGPRIPPDGIVPVEGGTENEAMRPLDFAPFPHGPARDLFDEAVIAADLERLAAEQRDDGGWPCDYATASPASALEWRGHLTVWAIAILTRNDVVSG